MIRIFPHRKMTKKKDTELFSSFGSKTSDLLKRIFDCVTALFGLILLSPLFMLDCCSDQARFSRACVLLGTAYRAPWSPL